MQWNEYEGLNGSSRCQLGYLERIKLYFRLEKKLSFWEQNLEQGM